jgi:hypothetical protein
MSAVLEAAADRIIERGILINSCASFEAKGGRRARLLCSGAIMSKVLGARRLIEELGVPPKVWNLRMLVHMFPIPGDWLNAFAKAVYFPFVTFTTRAFGALALSGAGWRSLFEAGPCGGYLR